MLEAGLREGCLPEGEEVRMAVHNAFAGAYNLLVKERELADREEGALLFAREGC